MAAAFVTTPTHGTAPRQLGPTILPPPKHRIAPPRQGSGQFCALRCWLAGSSQNMHTVSAHAPVLPMPMARSILADGSQEPKLFTLGGRSGRGRRWLGPHLCSPRTAPSCGESPGRALFISVSRHRAPTSHSSSHCSLVCGSGWNGQSSCFIRSSLTDVATVAAFVASQRRTCCGGFRAEYFHCNKPARCLSRR